MTPSERSEAAERLADRAIEVVRRLLDGSAHIEITSTPYGAPAGIGDMPRLATTKVRIICDD